MDISKRIRELRKSQGLNQFELAESVGISVDTVRRWESNKQVPRADELHNLSQVLRTTVDELLNGSQDGKVKLVVSWDWSEMKKGEINMNEDKFKLILDGNGKIGLHGAGLITSRAAIEEFLSKVRNELEIAFETQVRRGVIQEA